MWTSLSGWYAFFLSSSSSVASRQSASEANESQVSNKRAQAYCLSKGQLPHFECSAKDGANVDVAFEGMVVE